MQLRGLAVITLAMAAAACGGQSVSSAATGGSGGTATGGSGGSAGSSDGGPGGTGGMAADGGTPDASLPPGQHILFEVTYENYAWAPSLNGVFITDDGSVYSFDYFAGDAGAQPPSITYPATEQQIRSRYGAHPKKTGSIPMKELLSHFAKVEAAASGVLLRQYLCADAGEITSIGYLYDPSTAGYTQVILGMDGDQSGLNLAPAAQDLVKWLSQYAPSIGGGCTFISHECAGATCGSPAPTCPKNQLPSVENNCWSSCVNADQCLSVSDCSQCPGGMVCATAKDGSKHCLMSNCQSTDACSCPFTPPCAGGSAYCTSTGALRVRCGK